MSDLFTLAVGFVLRHEGGYVNDPADPGGETNMGISRRAYPDLPIALLPRDEVIALYRRDYWLPMRCDALPGQVAFLAFDAAVNQGVAGAVRMLQQDLGVEVDGVIGPLTLHAASAHNHDELALRYAARRAVRYATTANFERFGPGWMCRLMDCYRTALVQA